ncbi:phage holin family protein [Brevibacillus laterosporus]|uniref:phage holin family protein n=1 Tax=Brevibacillus laterosporus TaxID=1465 RepID=UPI003D210D5C
MRFTWELPSFIKAENGVVAVLGAAILPYVDFLYGSDRHKILNALFFLIALDWFSGIAAAMRDQTFSSDYGIRKGIPRTLIVLLLPIAANLLDEAMQTPGFLFYGVTFGLIYHTWVSFTANVARAGFERLIPSSILKFVGSELKAKAERSQRHKEGK